MLQESRRALLTHRAPTLDGDEEPLFRPRVQDAWEWQVAIGDFGCSAASVALARSAGAIGAASYLTGTAFASYA